MKHENSENISDFGCIDRFFSLYAKLKEILQKKNAETIRYF